jgi:small GTP-binding protein
MLLQSGQSIHEAKIVLLGSQTVGKTSLVTRLIRGSFASDAPSTIGASFLSKTIPVGNVQVKMQIWDTGGSERYRSMAPMYLRDAHAVIAVYDITSSQSFQELEDVWLRELIEKGPQSVVIGLAGNKADLHDKRVISTRMGEGIAQGHSIEIFYETSAIDGQNVQELFQRIAEAVINAGVLPAGRRRALLDENTHEQGECC